MSTSLTEDFAQLLKELDELAYVDRKASLDRIRNALFSRYCRKQYLETCEPEYCSYRLLGTCEYIDAIRQIYEESGINLIG